MELTREQLEAAEKSIRTELGWFDPSRKVSDDEFNTNAERLEYRLLIRKQAELTQCQSENAKLREERDLAIAHDTQPYPTSWAYEQVCKSLTVAKAEKAEAVKVAREAREAFLEFHHPFSHSYISEEGRCEKCKQQKSWLSRLERLT
jgi:hypothetical protein